MVSYAINSHTGLPMPLAAAPLNDARSGGDMVTYEGKPIRPSSKVTSSRRLNVLVAEPIKRKLNTDSDDEEENLEEPSKPEAP